MVEVQHQPVVADLAHDAGEHAVARPRRHLHDVADRPRRPATPGCASTARLTRCTSCALRSPKASLPGRSKRPRALGQAHEARLERGREFARPQRQRRRLAVERVHQVGAVGARWR